MRFSKESDGYISYLKKEKLEKKKILFYQILILVVFTLLWEFLANMKIIDTFLFSKPSDIYNLFLQYATNGQLFKHIGVSVYETIVGLAIGTFFGIIIAIMLWWSEKLSKILDPFLVVLNALPKTALAPIIIVWVGAGVEGIIVTAVAISIVVTILSAYNYFINVEEERYGIGYLIVYGSQVFKLDLVMMGVIVLAICAWAMYAAVSIIEKLYLNKR